MGRAWPSCWPTVPAATALLDQIVSFVADNKLQGVTVDFEDVRPPRTRIWRIFCHAHVGGLRAA